VDKARSPEEAEATGMSKVITKDVNNWIRGLGPQDSREFGVTNKNQALTEILLHMDIADARAYLTQQGYKHELIRCPLGKDGKQRWVLVFADDQQLLDLEKYGYAFQFDGAASLNKWSATMSSIMVQSSSGVWIPVGHMIVSEE